MNLKAPKCPECGKTGFKFNTSKVGRSFTLVCKCGNKIDVADADVFDYEAQSANIFANLSALSTRNPSGFDSTRIGELKSVAIDPPFENDAVAIVTGESLPAVFFHLINQTTVRNYLYILSSVMGRNEVADEKKFSWSVWGLHDNDSLPVWSSIMFKALSLRLSKDFTQSLILYSAAVEVYLEHTLSTELELRHGSEVSEYVLKKSRSVSQQMDDSLRLILPNGELPPSDIRTYWKENLSEKRNQYAHEGKIVLTEDDMVKAHRAAFRVIRWTNNALGRDYWDLPETDATSD